MKDNQNNYIYKWKWRKISTYLEILNNLNYIVGNIIINLIIRWKNNNWEHLVLWLIPSPTINALRSVHIKEKKTPKEYSRQDNISHYIGKV